MAEDWETLAGTFEAAADSIDWAADEITRLRARLAATEHERDELRARLDRGDLTRLDRALRAEARAEAAERERDEAEANGETAMVQRDLAAARVEALSEALSEIADGKPVTVDGVTYVRPGQERARAVLACPPQPFDPETSPGMTDLMVAPEAIDEYLAARPPERRKNERA